jgi:Tfp pilus assembly protein PilZ
MSDRGYFRASARPHVACKLTLKRAADPDAAPVPCQSRDVGTGGLFAVTEEEFVPGEQLLVELASPSTWDPLVLRAEVSWRRDPGSGEKPGVGVQFVDVSQEAQVALTRLVTSLDYGE